MPQDTQGNKETSDSGTTPEQDLFTNVDVDSLSPENREIYNSMLKDYRAKTEEIASQRKGFESQEAEYNTKLSEAEETLKKWNDWYNDEVKPYWDDFETYRTTGDQTQQQTTMPTMTDEDQIGGDNVIKELQSKISQFENVMTQKEVEFRNYINLNNQAWDLRLKHQNDPGFDINKVVEHAIKKNNADLYAAYNEVYKETEKERFAAAKIKEEREKWEKEQENKRLSVQTGTGSPGDLFGYQSPKKRSKQDTLAEVANAVAKKYPDFL
jgi:hypothetical protein